MKFLFNTLWLMAIGLLMCQNAIAQADDTVHFRCYHEPPIMNQPSGGQNAQASLTKYGGSFTPKGDITMLLIYAGFDDPNDASIGDQALPGWPDDNDPTTASTAPPQPDIRNMWYKNFSDFTTYANDPTIGELSKYYYEMSGGQLRIIVREFTDSNGNPIRVNVNPKPNKTWPELNTNVLDSMLVINPNFDVSGLDTRENRPNYEFDQTDTVKHKPDSVIDFISIIWRYNPDWSLQPNPGLKGRNGSSGGISYFQHFAGSSYRLNGLRVNSQGLGVMKGHKTNVLTTYIHEISHSLYSCPHYLSANGELGEYFTGATMQMGMMRQPDFQTLSKSALAYERYALGWHTIQANGINSDITSDSALLNNGIYFLRDYTTSSDAIRIKLPFVENQYVWIENHQSLSSFDVKPHAGLVRPTTILDGSNEPNAAIPNFDKGIYIYVENFETNPTQQSYRTNAIELISANGYFDWSLSDTAIGYYWGEVNEIYNFKKEQSNPFIGRSTLQPYIFDKNGDGRIMNAYVSGGGTKTEKADIIREYISENDGYKITWASTAGLNSNAVGYRRSDAFIKGDVLGINTNPTIKNLAIYDESSKKIDSYYLNGLKVEVLDDSLMADSSTIYKIKVSFNAIDVDTDLRWTGDIVLNDITSYQDSTSDSLIDMNIVTGKSVVIDRTGTPNSRRHPDYGLYVPSNFKLVNSILNLETGAELVIKNESTLEIATNAKIIANGTSKITIEETANLLFHPNAVIELKDNSELVIEGNLKIAENAIFTFSGTGKVIFNSPVPDNIVFAPGSSIELIGSGTSDVVAEVHQENLYLFRTGNDGTGSPRPDYDHIKISQGKVLMADNSRLCIDGDVELSHVVFDQLNSTDKPRGVYLYGQQNTTIEYCQFNHAKYGINCEDFLSYWLTNQLEINSSTFSNCDYGLFTRRKSTKLSNCTFNNCYYGWYAYGKPLPSVMHNGSITNCSEGIRIGGDFISLHLDGPDITNNSYGTRFYGRTLSAYCGDITDNYYGILAFGNELILSNNFKSKTGSVDLSDNTISITFDGEYLRLNNGNNDFSATNANTTGNLDITGHHPAWIGPVGAPSATAVFAANNIWAHTGLNEATYQDVSYGTVKVDGQDYFTLMYQEVPVEWNPAITTMGQCPSTYDSNNHGFNLVESGYHDLESGTPTLDFYELTGDNNHEFQGDDLQEAMETTIADLYNENVSNRFTLATNRLADILMVATNESSDAYVTYLLDYAYLRMMEAFGEACISEDALLSGGTLPQTVIDVQELIVDRMDDLYTNGETSAYYTRFNHSIDLAATYWLVDDLSSAITLLTDVTSWTTGSELDIANNLICRYNYENSVLTGVVPLENIIDTLYPCHDSLEIPYINSGGSSFVALSEQIAGAKPITIFPNPAQNIINYQFDASASELFTATVYNSKGQEVYTAGNIANKPGSLHQLDVSAFPAGMYLIKITSASRSQQARFTISR